MFPKHTQRMTWLRIEPTILKPLSLDDRGTDVAISNEGKLTVKTLERCNRVVHAGAE